MGERLDKGGIVVTKGSDLLVAALENEGVEYIFGVPGEENLDVVESLRGSSIELVLTRHEQSAAFMAATHGRLTGRPGRLHRDAGAGRAEPGDRCGLCASRRHADDPDHRPEGDHEQPAGALPDRRHGRDDAAADQVDAPDRQHGHHPDLRARRVPRGDGGAAGAGAPGAARGHRRRGGAGPADGAAAPDRAAGGTAGGARPRRRDDPGGQAAAGDAGRRRQPAAPDRRADRVHPPHPDPVLQHADGQGHGRRRPQALPGHRGALGARLRARGDRPRRPDRRDRPRHDREAAVPDGAGRAAGDPHQLHAGQCRAGLLPACRGGGRCRPEPGAAGRPARGQARDGLGAGRRCARRSWPGSRIAPTRAASRRRRSGSSTMSAR